MSKYNVGCLFNGILLYNKKKLITDKYYNKDEILKQ